MLGKVWSTTISMIDTIIVIHFITEFTGRDVKYFLEKEDIHFRIPITTLPAEASVVEAFNKTLKTRIARYLNWKQITQQPHEKRWIDALQIFIDDYNRTKHSRLGYRPIDVTKENAIQVYHHQRERIDKISADIMKRNRRRNHSMMTELPKEGDFVRVKRKRSTFEKGSMIPLWSDEIFRINRIIPRKPFSVYELIDTKGRVIEGKLYIHEIQTISVPKTTPVEIVQKPSIFDKQKRFKVKTLDGSVKDLDWLAAQHDLQTNNYFDVLRKLMDNVSQRKNKK